MPVVFTTTVSPSRSGPCNIVGYPMASTSRSPRATRARTRSGVVSSTATTFP